MQVFVFKYIHLRTQEPIFNVIYDYLRAQECYLNLVND